MSDIRDYMEYWGLYGKLWIILNIWDTYIYAYISIYHCISPIPYPLLPPNPPPPRRSPVDQPMTIQTLNDNAYIKCYTYN